MGSWPGRSSAVAFLSTALSAGRRPTQMRIGIPCAPAAAGRRYRLAAKAQASCTAPAIVGVGADLLGSGPLVVQGLARGRRADYAFRGSGIVSSAVPG